MNRENMERWIGALESGEYQQSFMAWHQAQPDGSFAHCAMGVGECLVNGPQVRLRIGFGLRSWSTHGEFLDWLGLDDDPRVELDSGAVTNVISANDRWRLSFVDIAQRLRKRYL